jgi:hypothetical protein
MDIQSERVASISLALGDLKGGSRNGRTLKSPLFFGDVAIGFARGCTLGKAEKVRSQFLSLRHLHFGGGAV